MNNTHLSFLLAVQVLLFVISATAIIVVKHQVRTQYTLMGTYQKQSDGYHLEWSQLLLEQATLAGGGRVKKAAVEHLDMKAPSDKEIKVVK